MVCRRHDWICACGRGEGTGDGEDEIRFADEISLRLMKYGFAV